MTINESAIQPAANLESINRSMALFLEADRLNDQAYALLNEPVSTQTIHKFSETKKGWMKNTEKPGRNGCIPGTRSTDDST
jgi:hypothetical protein